MADFPVIEKTVERMEQEAAFKKEEAIEKAGSRQGIALDPNKLFYRSNEKGLRKPTRISFDTLRRMSKATSIARLCINTLKHEIAKTKWAIVPVDPKEVPNKDRVDEVQQFFNFPNPDENFRNFLLMVLEDLLTLDAGTIELVNTIGGKLAEMYYIDGATIKPSIDLHGSLGNPAYLQYMPLNNTGKPDASFARDELAYIMMNPQGDIKNYGYGLSPLEGVIMVATNILNADNYNGSFFEVGTLPPLLINLGTNMPQSEVENFRAYWKAEIEGHPWKTAFLAGVENPEVMDLQKTTNRDMQFMEYQLWLSRLMTAAYEISPQDIGLTFDINKGTAQTQREISKAKGYRTVLQVLEETFTQKMIWKGFGYQDLCFKWIDVDTVDAAGRANVWAIDSKTGGRSINEYRKEIGLEPIKGGIKPFIMTNQGPFYIDATPLEDMDQASADDEQDDENGNGIVPLMDDASTGSDTETAPKPALKMLKGGDYDNGGGGAEALGGYRGDQVIEGVNNKKNKKKIKKTVTTTDGYLCWMDDRGVGQPFACTDAFYDDGYYIKPPVAVNLNGPDLEVKITHELSDMGLNVVVANKMSYKDIVNNVLASDAVRSEFDKYRNMTDAYYSAKWEKKYGHSRVYSYYIVSHFLKGMPLTDARVLADMKRDPESYMKAIQDLSDLWKAEKKLDLGDRRSNQYLITPDKRAYGVDYQFQDDDSFPFSAHEDAIHDALDDIPELQKKFDTLIKQKVAKSVGFEKAKMKKMSNEKVHDFYHKEISKIEKDLTKHINTKLKSIYTNVIVPKMKQISTSKQITKNWIQDVKNDWGNEDKKWKVEDTAKRQSLMKDVVQKGIDLSAFLFAASLQHPNLEQTVNHYLQSKAPKIMDDLEDTLSDRADASAESAALSLKDAVEGYLDKAMSQDLSYAEMSKGIKDIVGLDDSWRAERIARTESVYAANQAVIKSMSEMGVDKFGVLYGEAPCEDCADEFGDGDGPFAAIDIEDIPLHPNCECTANPIVPDNFDIKDLED